MKFRVALAVLLLSVFAAGSAFSQEAAADNAMKVTGELWMGLHMNLTKDTGNRTDLQLDRAQVNFEKKVSDMFTGKVIMEAQPVSNVTGYTYDANGKRNYLGNVGYGVYLKEAKIEVTPISGPLTLYGRAGITETPMGVFMLATKGDYWSNLEGYEIVTSFTGEKTYDALLGAGIKFDKLVDAYFTAGHGDGYKNLGGKNAPDYKYAYSGRITISPIEQLKINFFASMDDKCPQDEWVEENADDIIDTMWITKSADMIAGVDAKIAAQTASTPAAQIDTLGEYNRMLYLMSAAGGGLSQVAAITSILTAEAGGTAYNATDAQYKAAGKSAFLDSYIDSTDTQKVYYGGGIAWVDASIKAGFNYFMVSEETAGKKTANDGDQLIDIWANVNLKAFVGMPVAIYTGYSLMMDEDTKINGTSIELGSDGKTITGKTADITEWYVGAGYEFEEKAAMYLFYKVHDVDETGAEPEKALKFSATLKF